MKKRMITAALLAALAVPSFAMAQEVGPNSGALKFNFGADYVTGYYFRGALQDNAALIVQPQFGVMFNALDADDVKVDMKLSTWNSFTSGRQEGPLSWDNTWFESELIADAAVTAFGFKFNTIYTAYFYPSGAAKSIQEVGFVVGIDEKKFLGDSLGNFSLNPYLGWYFEIEDGNGEENQYIELGFNPSTTLDLKDVPYIGDATISFPVVLGLTMDHYFVDDDGSNELLGYVSVSAATSIPLNMPAKYGTWNLNGSLTYMYLNADSLKAANHDSNNAFVGKLGVSIAY